MKLLRYGPEGQEKPGLLDAQGKIRDLSGVVATSMAPRSPTPASPNCAHWIRLRCRSWTATHAWGRASARSASSSASG
ncbi:MAG: 2,4-diketo-3-deoxy-L-fuconate hydrolase [uncultured Paraburkholderia sp.]|nr:MAG: 2,4-diketo-3-deoxy-L-fuconate hydrolase [uncultured Paraburkholderia sp.]CAH2936887.1 MAG: 2,4-diketo-3-deoxy-L-fuconate hydrolase [uncultured Paraburkholderia sp.]